MNRIAPALLAAALLPALSSCLAKAAVGVVTAPVRVAGKAIDWTTTSQSEADEKRGRELRKREERLGKLQRSYDKQRRECDRGDRSACDAARSTYEEIQGLMPSVPYESR
jgi:hypothetical protein